MFRFVCTLLTVLAVLAHSVLGCRVCHAACRHQGCSRAGDVQTEGTDHSSCASSHGDHRCCAVHLADATCAEPAHDEAPAGEHPHHLPTEPCRSVGCSYVAMSIIKLPVLDAPACEPVPGDLFALDACLQLACVARAAGCYRSGYPPTERAQLWTGAWLV